MNTKIQQVGITTQGIYKLPPEIVLYFYQYIGHWTFDYHQKMANRFNPILTLEVSHRQKFTAEGPTTTKILPQKYIKYYVLPFRTHHHRTVASVTNRYIHLARATTLPVDSQKTERVQD